MAFRSSYLVLRREPAVVYAKTPWIDEISPRFETAQPFGVIAYADRKLTREEKAQAIQWGKDHLQRDTKHIVKFLLFDSGDVSLFCDKFNLPVEQFHFEALCDERVFDIVPQKKTYKAVSTSKLHDAWTYNPQDLPTHLRPGWFSQAKCGVAISSKNSANYEATEYLLCGIPVAVLSEHKSNPIFKKRVAVTYGDEGSIDSAIQLGRVMPPQTIRADTLSTMGSIRGQFLRVLRQVYRSLGLDYDPAYDLYHAFRHRMQLHQDIAYILTGGDRINQGIVDAVMEEPKMRKLWSPLSNKFWEKPLPEPVG